MREVGRERARTAIGATGTPLILWVGRLTTNKDPLTVLDALERALPKIPEARAIMEPSANARLRSRRRWISTALRSAMPTAQA
jgi:glycosyltransferase involved in cell wall biosynthesis